MSAASIAPRRQPALAPSALPRLLAGVRNVGRPVSLQEHLHRHGPLPAHRGRGPNLGLIGLVEASGLQGRGGASFPTDRKLRAVASAGGRRPVVVVNGAEGEPISKKDHVLLAYDPHLVLDGAAVAASAVGAGDVFVAVNASTSNALITIQRAIDERRGDTVSFRAVRVPDRFVAGEETALVSLLNGGHAKPTFTPPRPYERGVHGAPTLVQNAETLAHLALIARYGPDWFRGVGTRDQPGSALVTLNGAVHRPGVYEIPLGLPLRELLEWSGGPRAPLSAYLIGGYFGTWVSAADAESRLLLDSDLHRVGATLGARAIFAFPETACGVVETARLARYLADESARQCGPCLRGLDAIAKALERLARANSADQEPRLPRWLDQVTGRGACRHPDGAVRLVRSALHVFSDEYARHMRGLCSGNGGPLLPTGARRHR
ncbi:MAG: NADH-ubiquinone oxidoreductase-F iron-sulfur binding region domain-containing protein [Gaiellaceae bacterium]